MLVVCNTDAGDICCLLQFYLLSVCLSQFFDGYGYHGTSFEQTYRCYPASFIEKVRISFIEFERVYRQLISILIGQGGFMLIATVNCIASE